MSDPVPAPTGRVMTFYTPHQDDETLWAGKVISHHCQVGRDVRIKLATDGSTSAIRDALNGVTPNGWWGGYHYPSREGIPAPLSPADFAAARDRELIQAARALGVTPDRVDLRLADRGANITVAQAKTLILAQEAAYPASGHYTTHWTDPDPNHAALGEALRELALDGSVTDARWVVRRSQIGSVAGAVEYVVPSPYDTVAKFMTLAATRCYGAWCPPEAYAIGEHSVHTDMAWAASGASNWIVKTP